MAIEKTVRNIWRDRVTNEDILSRVNEDIVIIGSPKEAARG